MSSAPKIARPSLSAGMRWLTQGGELMGRGGTPLIHVGVLMLAITMIQLVPLIGFLALMLITPALTAGLLNVFAVVERGQQPSLNDFLAGLTDGRVRPALLALGGIFIAGVFVAAMILMAWLAPQVDLEALSSLASDSQVVNEDPGQLLAPLAQANWFGGVLIAGSLMALVLGALFFAVPLVFFWRWPLSAALLWGLRALSINWRALLGFGLVVVAFLMALGFLLGTLTGLLVLALGSAGAFLVQLIMIVASMFVQLLLAAGQWRAFAEVFPSDPETGRRGSPDNDDSSGDSGSLTA